MRTIIQKLSLFFPAVFLISSVAVPFLSSQSALAAKTYPNGTCFVYAQGQKPNPKVGACSKIAHGAQTSNGKPLVGSKCYQVDESVSDSNVTEVKCDGTSITKPVQVTPPAATTTPDNGDACKTIVQNPDGSGTKIADNSGCTDPAAAGSGNCSGTNGLANCDLVSKYLNPFINFLSALVGVAVTISIIIGGIQYGSSGGDPSKVTAAKTRIRNSIIALVAFLFLYSFLNFLLPGGLL